MGLAFAALHWTPDAFWNATAHEFFAGIEAFKQMNKVSDEEDGDINTPFNKK